MRTNPFDGPGARVVAKIMASGNQDAEEEAIEVLAPDPGDRIIAIGIGPGVGVRLLAERGIAHVCGIDPSAAMLSEARKRNRHWIERGVAELVQTTADCLPHAAGTFHGAVAVNSVQLWDPLEASLAEVARVLRPGGRLVALTHDWAIPRSTGRSVEEWFAWAAAIADDHGLGCARTWRANAEKGRSIGFEVTKAQEPA